MKPNKDGSKHAHAKDASDYRFVPTPADALMVETCGYALVKLTGIPGQRFARAYPDCTLLPEAVAALERLQKFAESKGTP